MQAPRNSLTKVKKNCFCAKSPRRTCLACQVACARSHYVSFDINFGSHVLRMLRVHSYWKSRNLLPCQKSKDHLPRLLDGSTTFKDQLWGCFVDLAARWKMRVFCKANSYQDLYYIIRGAEETFRSDVLKVVSEVLAESTYTFSRSDFMWHSARSCYVAFDKTWTFYHLCLPQEFP